MSRSEMIDWLSKRTSTKSLDLHSLTDRQLLFIYRHEQMHDMYRFDKTIDGEVVRHGP